MSRLDRGGLDLIDTFLKMKHLISISCLLLSTLFIGCASTGDSPSAKRQSVLEMREDVLVELYKEKPAARSEIAKAPGYGVFSNVNVNVIFASFGGGYGVVEAQGGQKTYMQMGEVGIGLGLGAKDFRAVFVFQNQEALDRFTEHGWTVGAQADAAAKSDKKGGSVEGEAIIDSVKIYQLTEHGLALQATVKGTKFWKSKELN